MSKATVEPTGFEGLMYRLAYASARFGRVLEASRVEHDSGRDGITAARHRWDEDDAADGESDGAFAGEADPLASLVAASAAGAVFSQLVQPRRVNWPRAILAGTIGTLLYDAEILVDSLRRRRKFGTTQPVWRGLLRGGVRARLGRYAAGIGMAGFYGRFLHGRLPLPAVLQGMAYGVIEAATRGSGGPVALLNRLAPELRVPLAYTRGIARPGEDSGQRVRRHLAFGLALGLIYRARDDQD